MHKGSMLVDKGSTTQSITPYVLDYKIQKKLCYNNKVILLYSQFITNELYILKKLVKCEIITFLILIKIIRSVRIFGI